jgi:hypothetical protein
MMHEGSSASRTDEQREPQKDCERASFQDVILSDLANFVLLE